VPPEGTAFAIPVHDPLHFASVCVAVMLKIPAGWEIVKT
jgi:hypothetical protein